MGRITIRPMTTGDADAVLRIYRVRQHGRWCDVVLLERCSAVV